MEFVIGPPPENPGFDPGREGWKSIREPSPAMLVILGLGVGLIIVLVIAIVFAAFTPMRRIDLSGTPALLTFIILIPIHELLHAAALPIREKGRYTILGVWPTRLLFYTHYEGELSRNRFLMVYSAPFLVLTVAPILITAAFRIESHAIAAVSIINSLVSGGDAVGLVLMAVQVPRKGRVRNRGWRTFWKVEEDGEA